jgi:hypothetical protein
MWRNFKARHDGTMAVEHALLMAAISGDPCAGPVSAVHFIEHKIRPV